ncbi:dual specificity protein phosphatase 3-like [Centruroides sculpturatus]|uniref:dual specificity protein phosphatase 3-like n=1 Tax=Centruroides sculpturatus TaxID=218467 RepID=UPI000C6CD156|nr:dual specificity protein phosphatase 3-like [Centruroides sculpturatus]
MFRRRPFRGAPRRNLSPLIVPICDDFPFLPPRSLSPLKSSRWIGDPLPPSCTPDELTRILVAPSGGHYEMPNTSYDEVYPNIILGDEQTAMSIPTLRRIGVTHVLNAAQGKNRNLYFVNTSSSYYYDSGIKFLGIEAMDSASFPLYLYFQRAADFIEEALGSGGKVYVHCRAGISRSAALVIAFLMIKRNMPAQEAVRRVRAHRKIIPNDGFLRQICDLNEKLSMERNNFRSSRGIP